MTTLEVLKALANDAPPPIPSGPAAVCVAAGFAEYIPAASLDEALEERQRGTRRVRLTDVGARYSKRRARE